MLEILASPSTPFNPTLLEISFEDQVVGSTEVIEKISGATLVHVNGASGEVVSHATLGLCFYFNGTGGLRFADNRTLPIQNKKFRILADYIPEDTTPRQLITTGGYSTVRKPGWGLLSNTNSRGDLLWVDSGSQFVQPGIGPIGIQRRQVEGKIGPAYGSKIQLAGSSDVGSAVALNPAEGESVYICGLHPIHPNIVNSFKGWLKSLRVVLEP